MYVYKNVYFMISIKTLILNKFLEQLCHLPTTLLLVFNYCYCHIKRQRRPTMSIRSHFQRYTFLCNVLPTALKSLDVS